MSDMLTFKQAGRVTGMTPSALYEFKRELGAVRLDGRWLVPRERAQAFFEQRVQQVITPQTSAEAAEMCRLRLARGLSRYQLARHVGCEASTLRALETGSTQTSRYLQPALAFLRDGVHLGDNEPQGNCAACGALLFAEADEVPHGWIVHWHVDCGGHCPECALRERAGDIDRAVTVLAEHADAGRDHPASDYRRLVKLLQEESREHAVG